MAIILNNFHSGEKISEEKLDAIDSNFMSLQSDIDNNTTDIVSLQNKVDDAFNPLTVTLTLDKTNIEMGSTVDSVVATWTLNKNVNSQTFEGEAIDATLRNYTYTTDLIDSKTFTLTCTTIGGTTVTSTKTLNFVNGIYFGVSSVSETWDSALISSLTKVLSGSRARSITVNSTANTYIYYCLPTRLSTGISFSSGGFTGGFSKVATISFTNSSGYTENYDIFKSEQPSLGNTTITIS